MTAFPESTTPQTEVNTRTVLNAMATSTESVRFPHYLPADMSVALNALTKKLPVLAVTETRLSRFRNILICLGTV